MDLFSFPRFLRKNAILLVFLLNLTRLAHTDAPHKLRLCMVPSRETSSQVTRLCEELEAADGSGASCSIAPDRLTCLRRVARDKADFATFQIEDVLVAARRNTDDLAITNQLRTLAKPAFEYEVAAVVRNSANISSLSQLRNSTFCHPGHGFETDWTGVVSRFLEVRVIPQSCEPSRTLFENSLNSSADFFRAACQAGPWVPDPDLDAELKSRYPSLCQLCDKPDVCSTIDKYWGRVGPLLCLADGLGDVVWARLDYIRLHFAPDDPNLTAEGSMYDFSFLCVDGSLQSLQVLRDKSARPCAWISRPWPVVIANTRVAGEVQHLVKNLALANLGSWERALLLLLAPVQQHTPPTQSISSPEEMLSTVSGWLNAATVSPCGEAGSPVLCVRAGAESSKCQWLSEAARAHGVRGAPFCKSARHARDCLRAVASGEADMTMLHPDLLLAATRDFGLRALLYERPDRPDDLYLVTAFVTDLHHWTLADLRGKRACFPSRDGASWKLVTAALRAKAMVPAWCDDARALASFFSWFCVNSGSDGSAPRCPDADVGERQESADHAALRCLAVGHGDVAFVDKAALQVLESNVSWARHYHARDFNPVCSLNLRQGCHIGWAPHGMLMVRGNASGVSLRQWRVTLERLDEMFGPNYRSATAALHMFAPFDSQPNLIFHNSTRELVDYETLTQDTAAYALDLVQVLRQDLARCPSAAPALVLAPLCLLACLLLHVGRTTAV